MFDVVRNNRRFVQFFLVLITLPFALWGVESYIKDASGGNDVATVGGQKIAPQEFQQALMAQQDKIRTAKGSAVQQSELDSPEVRKGVLESLVVERLLGLNARDARLFVSDQQLAQVLMSAPELQSDGKFSRERYEAFVTSQGMTVAGFEARLRSNILNRQLLGVIGASAMPGRGAAQGWATRQLEVREVADAGFSPDEFVGKVKLEGDAAQKFYEAHRAEFEVPEQVKVEYLTFSRQQFATQLAPSDDDVKAWYASHVERFKQAEERRASHILVTVDAKAAEADVKVAREKIDGLLAQVKKSPASFVALAKQHSQDPGSAAKGGDLGWFPRGAMVKAFEDTAFAMKEGQISDVVRSDFGFHIIQLTGAHAEKIRPLEEVRGEVVAAARDELAQKKFAESSEAFTNTVYEQSDSLKPAAEKFHLTVEQGGWLAKGAKGGGALANAKLLAALFADDAIKNGRNTEAVEIAPGTLVAARVVEHKPAALKSLDDVRGAIEKRLIHDEAAKLARQAGEEALSKLTKGEAPSLVWGNVRAVSKADAQGLSVDSLRAIYKADASKLPAYTGSVQADGRYALFRINAVKPFAGDEKDERVAYLRQQYERLVASEEVGAWLAAVRGRYPVEINTKLLESR